MRTPGKVWKILMNKKAKKQWIMSMVQQHESGLISYAFCFVKNIEVARDLVQDTFLKLWQQDTTKLKSYPKAWMFYVCRNHCLDYLKKEKPMVSVSKTSDINFAVESKAGHRLETQQSNNQLYSQISKLDQKHQEVLRLKFQNEMSYKQIAKVTGHSISYVGVLLHEGIRTLRKSMKGVR